MIVGPVFREKRGKFFAQVFGRHEGYLCLARKKPNTTKELREAYFAYPQELDQALDFVDEYAPAHDMYFCAQLLDKKRRVKENIAEVAQLWADLDGCPLEVLQVAPTIAWETSEKRTQAIWRLEAPIPAKDAETLSHAIALEHKNDGCDQSGWDLTQLLRIPFTFNHKYGPPYPNITIVDARPGHYRPEDFNGYEQAPEAPTGGTETPLPDLDAVASVDELLGRVPEQAVRLYFDSGESHKQGRSGALWNLECELLEAGLSPAETLKVAWGSACNKFGQDGRPIEALWDDVLRAQAKVEAEKKTEQASGQSKRGRQLVITKASAIMPQPVHWLIDDNAVKVPLAALTLHGGREGIGKSISVYTYAAGLTKGTVPGRYNGKPCNVFVAATEDSWAHVIVPRLMAAGADLDRVFQVELIEVIKGTRTYGSVSLPKDLPELEQVLASPENALLILDPLISRLEGKDTHKSQEVRQALEPLQAMLDRTQTACIGLIHLSKRADTDPLTLFVAARAFVEVARAALFSMTDPEHLDTRLIGQVKNNYGPSDLPAREYHIDGVTVAETDQGTVSAGKLEWGNLRRESIREILESAKESGDVRTATREAKDWLEDYLKSVGGKAPSNEIKTAAKKAGHSESTLNRARRKLKVQVENEGFPRVTYWKLSDPEFVFVRELNDQAP